MSVPVALSSTGGTDDQFADGLAADTTRIVTRFDFPFATRIDLDDVEGLATVRVLPGPGLNDDSVSGGAWGNHAETELTAKHFAEPL